MCERSKDGNRSVMRVDGGGAQSLVQLYLPVYLVHRGRPPKCQEVFFINYSELVGRTKSKGWLAENHVGRCRSPSPGACRNDRAQFTITVTAVVAMIEPLEPMTVTEAPVAGAIQLFSIRAAARLPILLSAISKSRSSPALNSENTRLI
jgi:hypothetical protein